MCIEQDWRDVLALPSQLGPPSPLIAIFEVGEGIGFLEARASTALSGQRIDHIGHDRIIEAVAHEYDGEFPKQLGDEPGSPPLCEIGAPKIGCRQYEILPVGVCLGDTAVKIHKGAPAMRLGQGEFWCAVNRNIRIGELKTVIEVGCDETNAMVRMARQAEKGRVGCQ